jgi:hypothetical protein
VTRILAVGRAVVQVDPKFHPTGLRFLVKEYPKDREYRYLKLSKQLTGKVETHIEESGLGPEDLIFAMPPQDSPPPGSGRCPTRPRSASPGQTLPGASTGTGR